MAVLIETNKYQTPITQELLDKYPQEVQEQFLDFINNVPYIKNLISPNRPYTRDLPKDENGRAIIDLTNPPLHEDMDYFKPTALNYQKYGKVCNLRPNPNPNSEYGKWIREEVRRIYEGYTREDGEFVTGDMYYFLNYCPILLSKVSSGKKALRVWDFPEFWEGHWLKFIYSEMARNNGHHCAELASRSKGKSFSLASMIAKRFILGESREVNREVKCLVTAYQKEYLTKDGILNKFQSYIDFAAQNTEFPTRRLKSSLNEMAWKMGYIDLDTNTQKGTLNEVLGVSSKDDESKLRGKRSVLIAIEEFGSFPNLLGLFGTLRPSVEEGDVTFGEIYMQGTSGDNDSDFAAAQELMYNPKGYNIQEIPNIYDKEGQGKRYFSYFFPGYLNRKGCYDKDGNSDVVKALLEILMNRYTVKYNSTDLNAITKTISEIPVTPQEAIIRVQGNIFPVTMINERLNEIDNNPAFYDDIYVGKLVQNNNGEVIFRNTTDIPIRDFPTKDNKVEGALEIYEMPIKQSDGKVNSERYILSCLPKGEKVNTSNGLKNVENITINDKLINKEGKEVNIINCQQYYNTREIYNIKLSSIFDSTRFTYNHPIYCATPKIHYHNANVCKKYNLKQKYYTYDFSFKQAQDVKVGDYVKTPILYQETKNISHYWQDYSRIDRRIENPLDKEDFWYLVGVILGDGWASSDGYNIGIVFNKKEKYLIDKCKKIVSKIFNRKFSKVREEKSTVTYQFSCNYFNSFFKQYFGVGAENKFIFNDFKYIREDLKKTLILGYVDTDGYIRDNGIEIVSISKRLLNDIQDILFSLHIINSVHLLRKKSVHYIVDRYSSCKDTYTLRIGKLGTSKIYDWNLDSMKVPMFKGYTTIDHDRKYSFIKNGYLYLRVMNVTKEEYRGIVYNFACDTHTFMCNYIPTHNCDNYENDTSNTMSLGSIFVLDLWTDRIVAEYTGRPMFVDDLNEVARLLCFFYNGKLLYENNKKNTFAYFSKMNCLWKLEDTPEYLRQRQMVKNVGYGNTAKGVSAIPAVKNHGFTLIRDWLLKPVTILSPTGPNNEEIEIQVPNLHFVKNRALLKELSLFNPDINVDRIMSLVQLMIFREQKMITYQGDVKRDTSKIEKDYAGNDEFFTRNFDARHI